MTSKSKTSGGKKFEDNWKKSYEKLPIYYLRLQDAAKWNRGSASSFTPENPYDSLQYKIPFIWLLELKSTQQNAVSFNPVKPTEKPVNKKTQVMIKANQVKQLMEATKKDGVIPGFVINFRERVLKTVTYPDETYFVHINDFVEFAETSGKSGLNREDCISIGLKIYQEKKKVNFAYDVARFSLESPKMYLNKGYINKETLIQARNWINDLIR